MQLPSESRLFHAGRLLWPGLPLSRAYMAHSLAQTHQKIAHPADFSSGNFHLADWWLARACLWNDPEGRPTRDRAWGHLVGATLAREGRFLTERLAAKALRAFPRDESARQEAIDEFWGQLLTGANGPGRLHAYTGRQPLVPWMVATFRNLCVDKLRRRSRSPFPLDHEDDWPGPPVAVAGDDLGGDFDANEAIDAWFVTLTDRQRALADLRFRHGLNQKEAAVALATTESTVSRELVRIQESFTALVDRIDGRLESPREAIVEALHIALVRSLGATVGGHPPARKVASA